MIIENDKLKVSVDIFNKKKFEISYREWNQEFVFNEQTFIYELGMYITNKIDNSIKRQSIVITQMFLEEQYQPLWFSRVFAASTQGEERALEVYNTQIESTRNNYKNKMIGEQTLEFMEVDYKNFEYYCQSIDNNPNKNIYIQNFLLEIIEEELKK